MQPTHPIKRTSCLRRLGYCLLPVLLGAGGALVLLVVAGRPARPAYAANHNYPGCAATIQLCIDNASAGDTIVISAGDYTESLTLSKAVSLTGALSSTTILHALPNTRVLTVTGAAVDSSVIISGLTFAGGHAAGGSCPDGCGGAILITATAQPLLINLTISNSLANLFGGGLFNDLGGNATLSGSRVTSNTANNGGGVYSYGTLTITSSTITGNTAGVGGGISSYGTLTITSSAITGNTAGVGGGISSGGTLTITGSTITSNTAGVSGGGVYNSANIGITSSTISNNTSTGGGGGLTNDGGNATLTSSAITSNTATGYFGGGIANYGTLTLTSSTIGNNTAYTGGGGVYNSANIAIASSTITSNTATGFSGYGGGGIANYGTLTLTSSTISNNTGTHGGGLYNSANIAITSSTITSNTATGFGGGLTNDGGNATLTSSTVSNNTATGNDGGGIFSNGTLTITSSTVSNNTASNVGGGLFNNENATLTSSTITSNTAIHGGGIFSNGMLTITSSTVSNNTAPDAGGVYNYYGTLTLSSSTVTSNTATSFDGGGIINGGTLTMTSSTINSNTAYSAGGGVENGGTLTITNSNISNNTATTYSAGGVSNYGTLTIDSSTIASNTATGEGGYGGGVLNYGTLAITSSAISNNTARNSGGGLYTSGGNLAITSSAITSNTATYSGGGGVYTVAGNGRIVNALLAGNSASQQGAALYLASPGSITILHTTIASPTLGSGAAIVVVSGTVGITDTIIASYTTGISQTAGTVFQNYNLFFGNGTNTTGTVSGGGHSLIGDPAFVDPTGYDYHLSSGSLAIDAGTDAGVTTDFDGDPRPQGAGFDIGFDESPFTAVADVDVTKSASASMRQPGQSLTYALVYSNAGPQVAAGVRLTDIVPANLVAVTYTSSGTVLTPVGLSQYAWQTANLAPGAGGVVTVTGVLSGGLHGTVFTNTATITTTSSDSNVANNTSAVSVTVANAPPVSADDAYTLPVNSTLTVTARGVLANDTDANNDPLTAVPGAGPLTGTLNLHADGSFTYTPPLGYSGVVTFTYRANDGLADSNTATVTLTVTPIANLGLVKSASASLLAPGQLLTYTLVFSNAGPSLAAGVRLTDIVPTDLTNLSVASSGALITATSSLTYAWQVADLAPGAGGVVTMTGVLAGVRHGTVFTNTATITTTTADSNSANNTSTVSVTVANAPPVAVDDAYTLAVNSTLTITAPGVLANDTDANGDPLTAVLAAGQLTGTLSLHADGSFTYTPPLGYSGVVTFTYRANDGLANSNAATVTLTVSVPVANLGLVKTVNPSVVAPGQRLTYTLVFSNAGPSLAAGVRLTDIVPANLVAVTYTSSGAALTPVSLSKYAWQVANLAPGAGGVVTVTGVLSGGLHGTVFTNAAAITSPYSDTNPANNISAVSVTVANVPPVAADDVYTVTGNTTLTVTAPGVLLNDTDANGDPLTAVVTAMPFTGTLNLHADGSFTYTPPHGFAGVVMFTYRANDGLANSNSATVTITVAWYKLYLPVVLRP